MQPSPFLRPLTIAPASGDSFLATLLRVANAPISAIAFPFIADRQSKRIIDEEKEDANMMEVADVGMNNSHLRDDRNNSSKSEAAIFADEENVMRFAAVAEFVAARREYYNRWWWWWWRCGG